VPLASAGVGVATLYSGAPPDLAVIVAASVGHLVNGVVPSGPSREVVIADEVNRERRARSYEEFGAAVSEVWFACGVLLTFKPKPIGYVHGLATLTRAQRRFQSELSSTIAAVSNVLLYGSYETQVAAIRVVETLGQKLKEGGGAGKQGSPEVRRAYDSASAELGEMVVVWRKAAQADLGLTAT
jgi:hypothetical protein